MLVNCMINLEGEIVSLLDDMKQGKLEITSEDVKTYFKRSKSKIERLLIEKNAKLAHYKRKLEDLDRKIKADNTSDENLNPSAEYLKDLHEELKIATIQFNNKKQQKYESLVKRLKISIINEDQSETLSCLFSMHQLRAATKDIDIVQINDKITKYTKLLTDTVGTNNLYVSVYSYLEEKELLLQEIIELQAEIQDLNNTLN